MWNELRRLLDHLSYHQFFKKYIARPYLLERWSSWLCSSSTWDAYRKCFLAKSNYNTRF